MISLLEIFIEIESNSTNILCKHLKFKFQYILIFSYKIKIFHKTVLNFKCNSKSIKYKYLSSVKMLEKVIQNSIQTYLLENQLF